MPKVSVIVPVYNVESYLEVCIDSILAQTLRDIEIICVDDGSTDRSPWILDAYAERYEKVRVIHRDNHGYGQSINVGIAESAGEYIGIVESDDRILPNMYEKLYQAAKEHDLDFVKSDCIFWWNTLDYFYNHHRSHLEEYYNRVLEVSHRRVFYDFFMNIWTGIYKKEFLEQNQIRCNETPGASYQDNGFWIQTMSLAERVMWLGDAFYLYRQDNPGASIKSKSKALAMKEEYDFVERILEEKGRWKELDICHYYRMARHRGTFKRIADELKREYAERILLDFRKYREVLAQNEELLDWMQRLDQDPQGFCSAFIREKSMALRRLSEAESLIIYGAGFCGQKSLRILDYQGMSGKIVCFAVSDEKDSGAVGNIPIRCIDELTEYRDQALVVIGTYEHTETCRQMRQRLEKLQFCQTLDFHVLTQYFYFLV